MFAAPPSGSADYVGDIRAALDLWDGSGSFVFTSSAGVYTVEDGSGGCWLLGGRRAGGRGAAVQLWQSPPARQLLRLLPPLLSLLALISSRPRASCLTLPCACCSLR